VEEKETNRSQESLRWFTCHNRQWMKSPRVACNCDIENARR